MTAPADGSQYSSLAYFPPPIPEVASQHCQNFQQYSYTSSTQSHGYMPTSDYFNQGGIVKSDRAVTNAKYAEKLSPTKSLDAARLLGAKYEASLHLLNRGFMKSDMETLLYMVNDVLSVHVQDTIKKSESPNASLLHYWVTENADDAVQVFETLVFEIKQISPRTGEKLYSLKDKVQVFQPQTISLEQARNQKTCDRCSSLVKKAQDILNDYLTASDLEELLYITKTRQLISAEDYKTFQIQDHDLKTNSVVEKWFEGYQKQQVHSDDALKELAEVTKALRKVVVGDTLLNLLNSS